MPSGGGGKIEKNGKEIKRKRKKNGKERKTGKGSKEMGLLSLT